MDGSGGAGAASWVRFVPGSMDVDEAAGVSPLGVVADSFLLSEQHRETTWSRNYLA